MARYKNGINGPVSGKVGSVIGASWRGIPYLKSAGTNTKTASAAQLNSRRIFAVAMGWVKPLLALINIGYQVIKTAKTPLNAAVSYHIKEAIISTGSEVRVDFAKAILSRGELLISFVKELLALIDAVLYIKWDNAPVTIFSNMNDVATFVVYNPAREKFITFQDVAYRSDQEVMLQLPANFEGDEVHTYMYYVNEVGDQVSTSLYLGSILVV